MTKFLLAALIVVASVGSVHGSAFMLAGGLSFKNALLYSAFAMLIVQVILGQRMKIEMPGVFFAFGLFILYSIGSLLAVANAGTYPNYSVAAAMVRIKTEQLDWMIYFACFTMIITTAKEAQQMMKLLVAGVGICNVFTIWNAVGLPQIGADAFNPETPDGLRRINGYFGHANETASLVVMLLPVMFVIADAARGVARGFWFGLTAASCMVVVGTSSRGAIMGVVIGSIWAGILCRRYLSPRRAVRWLAVLLLLGVVVVPFIGTGYLDKFIGRFTGVSTVSASDITSGRTDMWISGIRSMMARPWSFITGVGWNTWVYQGKSAFGVGLPHNQYLSFYFDLGVIGLGCFIYIAARLVSVARRAVVAVSKAELRTYPLAYVFGILCFCVAILTSNITAPWVFVWPFLGLVARHSWCLIADAKAEKVQRVERVQPQQASEPARDPYSFARRPVRPVVVSELSAQKTRRRAT